MFKRPSAFFLAPLLVLLLLIALVAPAAPQDSNNQTNRPRKVFPKEPEPEDVLRIDTDLVSVDVTAMNSLGQPVKNLRPEDFKLYSDGVEQQVAFFQVEKREGEPR